MRQKPKRKRSIIVRVAVLCLSVYMIATLIGLGNKYAELKEEESRLLDYKSSLELSNQELEALLESDSHKEIIEKAARERLGFVYSGEEIYIDISGN